MVKRDIYIFSYDKINLINEKISDKENYININELSGYDSLRIIIKTEEIIVLDQWIKQK